MSDDLPERLEKHVRDRSGPVLANGAWQMMLDAAARIRELESRLVTAEADALERARKFVNPADPRRPCNDCQEQACTCGDVKKAQAVAEWDEADRIAGMLWSIEIETRNHLKPKGQE